ncbi:MarR family winged helix-turn-helix transcriptional regulator [Streptomyces capillispiralis]|uniref:MarR family transcriptional regulator n=1 Tax=Streptomyces capillispiralis TaxID=68182 RepID=A0A561T934_9ACTN|nr:MarR family winged helix-turn-helix transcriptional regulator [Streptomyces capillispiralis]TWF83622.1 MarR family transcriptional regulator [Streptomyces capillispiralis]GHH91584.1 MarR family transcriptional regulator [Streptomyces capillispiralis]
MDAPPRWLDHEEKAAWDNFIRMQEQLIGRLSRHLQADSGMSAADYIVLVSLTERGDGRMRFLDLAKLVEWEKSRMSHQVTRMAKRGLVAREECPDDGRGAFIVATPAGYRAIQEAAPQHVEHVRRLFIDALTPNQLSTLARLSKRVLDHMEKQPD